MEIKEKKYFRSDKELKSEVDDALQPVKVIDQEINPTADVDIIKEGQFISDSKGRLYFRINNQLNQVSGISIPTTPGISRVISGAGVTVHNELTGRDIENCHPISAVIDLQTTLDSKETPEGAQDKVNVHANRADNPHNVTKEQVGISNHNDLPERDVNDCHPIGAITNLQDTLNLLKISKMFLEVMS